MENLLADIIVANLPTIMAIGFWAHRIDKRISLIEAHIWPRKGRENGKA